MTAEVVVMNKLAVALAADSAVTITHPNGQKIYNSANKLFMLSPHHSVGVMFYGSAEFMGVPWETIIKIYTKELPQKPFELLSEYSRHFLAFIRAKNEYLFPEALQDAYFKSVTELYFHNIRIDISQEVERVVDEKGEIQEKAFVDIIHQTIRKHHAEWDNYELLSDLPENYVETITDMANFSVPDLINTIFTSIPLPEEIIAKLKDICIALATKRRFPTGTCGVVFAGFGDRDVFPSVEAFELEGGRRSLRSRDP